MILKVFTKVDCPNCPPAKNLAQEIEAEDKLTVEYHDVDTAEGLAEAQFFTVLATPTLVLCDQDEQEFISWRGEVPEKEEIYKANKKGNKIK